MKKQTELSPKGELPKKPDRVSDAQWARLSPSEQRGWASPTGERLLDLIELSQAKGKGLQEMEMEQFPERFSSK